MKNLLYLSYASFPILFAVFITAACQDREMSESVQSPAENEDLSPAVFMNDSIWRADSLRMWDLWTQYWFYDDNMRHDSAIAVCREMIRIGKPMMEYRYDSTIYEKYAKGYGGIGYNLLGKGQFEESLIMTRKSFDLISAKFGEDHPRNAELCTGFTEYYIAKGDYEQALNYCDKSLRIRQNYFSGMHYYIGNVFNNYANVHYEKGDYTAAISYTHKAIDVYRKTAPAAQTAVYHRLGVYYLIDRQYHKAIASCREAISIATGDNKSKDHRFIYFVTGQLKDEWHYFDLPGVYIIMGAAYRELGDYEKSLASIQYGQKLAEMKWQTAGDYLAESWLELGRTYGRMNEPGKAMAAFLQVEPIQESFAGGGDLTSIKAWEEAAMLQERLGYPDSALICYQRALHLTSPTFSIAGIYQNPAPESLGPSMLLLQLLRKKAAALYLLYERSKEDKNLHASLANYTMATMLIDELRHSHKWESSQQSLSENTLPIFSGAIQCALDLERLTGAGKYREVALLLVEKSKAYTLKESLKSEKAKSIAVASSGLITRENEVQEEIALYQQMILEENQKNEQMDSARISYWNGKLVDLKNLQDSIANRLEEEHPEYYNLKYLPHKTTIAQFRHAIDQNEMLIEYFLADSVLYTFAITQNDLAVYQQSLDANFYGSVDQFLNLVHHPRTGASWTKDFRQFVEVSADLFDVLLAQALLENKPPVSQRPKLVIIPDGILNFIPFNLLLTSPPSQTTMTHTDYRSLPYLLQSYDIRYEFSASLMAANNGLRSGSWWRRLMGGNPTYYGFAPGYGNNELISSRSIADSIMLAELYPRLNRAELGALAFNQPEVETAARTAMGRSFTGYTATEKAFKQKTADADILHLAMHAVTNDKEPLYSQLIFERDEIDSSEDGRLHAYEIYPMRLNADLSVLSACNTGSGKLLRGEGVMSLSRAFRYAGCSNIVMSLWTANDHSTNVIVSDFFFNLKMGLGKDSALSEAQRTYISEKATQNNTHPYYWSTLVLIGDRAPVWHPGIPPVTWLVGALLCIVFIYLRRNRQGK